jgi:hypothetical protein
LVDFISTVILNFSKTKKDAIGYHQQWDYAELDDKKIRRSIIFCNEGDLRVEYLKSALDKCGFQVHLIDPQHLLTTLEKSDISNFHLLNTSITYFF